ncbi:MAG: BTAD domain-containing putative transcriptional regulator, partial [Chloroflexi bacterium]|nr:BTAD domain-containing putative transcriptional regulator [Chloroflexota bacterium]
MLQLNLLGSPQIILRNQPLTNQLNNKAQALLFYLALTGQTHSRDKLAALFWADVQNNQARKNLRDVLPHLRKYLGDYVLIGTQTVGFDLSSDYKLDIDELRAGLTLRSPSPPALAALDATLALYTEDFLDGFYVRNAPLFEEWVLLQREAIHAQIVQASLFLVSQYMDQGNYEAGLNANRRLLAFEPIAEVAHRYQMRLLAYSGQRSAALAQYEYCQRVIASELDAIPDIETTTLYEQIRAGILPNPVGNQESLPVRAVNFAADGDEATVAAQTQTLVELHLFNTFYVRRAGQIVDDFRSDKVRALLAYLVVEGKTPIYRSHLIELFWGRNELVTARGSLRVALTNLRQLLMPLDLIQATRQTVQFQTDHPQFWCDALLMDALLDGPPGATDPRAAETVTKLVDMEFLPGLGAVDSPAFEAWRQARQFHYLQLRSKQREAGKLAEAPMPSISAPATSVPAHMHNLPRQLTPFIGRQMEITTIRNKLQDERYPWLTIVGEGGVGKTRLALTVAAAVQADFSDGVWFVPLAGVTPGANLADRLAVAVGAALNLTFVNIESLTAQLFAQLRNKQLLLLLDNFEHL